jgi:hypothetical protein
MLTSHPRSREVCVGVSSHAGRSGRGGTALAAGAVFVAAIAVFVGPAAQPAHACSCVGWSDEEAFAWADAVFLGELVDYEAPPQRDVMSSTDPATWTFMVTEVYKGDVAATQEIVSAVSGASCGLEIPHTGDFYVFARSENPMVEAGDGQLVADLCGGTRSIGQGPLAVADVVPLPPPTTEPPATEPPATEPPATEPPGTEPAAPTTDEADELAVPPTDGGSDPGVPIGIGAVGITGGLVALGLVVLRRRELAAG